MHSHMYFYAESARPDWSAPPPSDDAAKARVRAIADALLEAVPALREWRREDKDDDGTGVGMYLSPLDWIAVYGALLKYDDPRVHFFDYDAFCSDPAGRLAALGPALALREVPLPPDKVHPPHLYDQSAIANEIHTAAAQVHQALKVRALK